MHCKKYKQISIYISVTNRMGNTVIALAHARMKKNLPFFPIIDMCFVNIGDMIAAKEKEIGMIARIIGFVSSLNTTWLVKQNVMDHTIICEKHA